MKTIEEQSIQYRSLYSAPKPRLVRVKPFYRAILVAFLVMSIMVLYSITTGILSLRQAHIRSTSLLSFAFALTFWGVLLIASVVTFWRANRDEKLMREGEIAVGVVTHQKLVVVRGGRGGRRTKSKVRYRFKDFSGQLYQGTGMDDSRRLRVDMTVPVFYDPQAPEKNVTICTASCELVGN